MPRRIGLGRGLDALLDNNENENMPATPEEVLKQSLLDSSDLSPKKQEQEIVLLPIEKLIANPNQPRKIFEEDKLQELAESIKAIGIIYPVIVKDTNDDSYIIIAGERRVRAAKIAGLTDVPAVIHNYNDLKSMEISLIENIQRSDLNPMEEAVAYKNLMDFSAQSNGKPLSQDDLALRVGKNRSTVANALRLLKLPAEIQKSIEDKNISPGHARALLSVTDAKSRDKLYREVLASDLSVRETEKRAAVLNAEKPAGKDKEKTAKEKHSKRPPEIDAMEEKFISKLGTKVMIDGGLHKGKIIIEYYSMEDLERLYEILG